MTAQPPIDGAPEDAPGEQSAPHRNPVERVLRAADAFQQRHTVPAFVVGVIKKYGDDRGSMLAALFAYYGFLALFPLLLLLTTILGLLLRHDETLQNLILDSTLGEFPIIGKQLGPNIHSLQARGAGFVFGSIGLLYGSLGLAQTGQHAMAQVWNVPGVVRPGFLPRLGRSLVMLVVLGLAALITTGGSIAGTFDGPGIVVQSAALALSAISNVVLFVLAFRVLTPRSIPGRQLLLGGVLAGLGWSVLQAAGGYLVNHQLRHAGELYGLFGIVLGFLSFLSLGGAVTLYAAEANVVLARRLWPRSILQPPLTAGDRQVLTDIAEQEERRPEQEVDVTFDDSGTDDSGTDDSGTDDSGTDDSDNDASGNDDSRTDDSTDDRSDGSTSGGDAGTDAGKVGT
jgi:YihY family inner membrane protein